ncbi:hypothetical protein [Fulvivirga ligni]|uniref:hypothetical protein n=1 Tax=Fulvivirga ligni TaxID=2904246 RepID=UPI001F31982D|nr:hypothetical protein [Fulvivirga ligni]UII20313.1 hypothetical protein LVD16_20950 [Fulvivirga ligni]
MNHLTKILVIFVITICIVSCRPSVQKVDLIIKDISIVDVEKLEVRDGQSVMINQGVIVSIGADSEGYEADQEVNGEGKYLIPGLWDMHTLYRCERV